MGMKEQTPLRRASGVSHDQLVAHWRDVHAPGVRAHMRPDRYAITFFDPRGGRAPFDGMASLAYDDAAFGVAHTGRHTPAAVVADGFGERVEVPLARTRVVEHVIVAGPAGPGGPAATVEEREAAFKMTFLVSANPGEDLASLHRHWLEVHAPNVASAFIPAGGVRYVVNLADPSVPRRAFAGIAEIWYRDQATAKAHRVDEDGFNDRSTRIALPGREWVVEP